jgi:hypothetical protein
MLNLTKWNVGNGEIESIDGTMPNCYLFQVVILRLLQTDSRFADLVVVLEIPVLISFHWGFVV